jgi:serine phosphatase RsbU (regulator of sigma subunit)
MTIKSKILILCLASLFVLTILIFITIWLNLTNTYKVRIDTLRNDQINDKKSYLNELVNFAELITEETYTDSMLLIEKTDSDYMKQKYELDYKNKAKNFLSALRYDKGNGFFLAYELRMDEVYYAFHGIKFNLWGKVAEAFDRHGTLYRKQIIDNAKKGEGYTVFVSEKPSTGMLTQKIAYGEYFKPWEWVIVSGIFTDDIEAKVTVLKSQLNNEVRNILFLTFIVLVATVLIVVFIVIFMSNRITKPIVDISNHAESVAREGKLSIFEPKKKLNEKTEEGKLVSSFNVMVKAVMKAEKSLKEKERLAKEMEIAEKIQTAIVPPPPLHDELEITAVMKPAEEVGGDYYDIIIDKKKNLWFAIGDVSGHGVTPGLVMMMAQTSFSTNINERPDITPRDAIIAVNSLLCENVRKRLKESHFMTMNFLKYTGSGNFMHAGSHLDILVYRTKTKKCENIKTEGVFLGIVPDVSKVMKDLKFVIEKDDIMLLYTDGVIEARHKGNRDLMGVELLKDMMVRHADKPLEEMKDNILKETLDWCGNHQDDDITMVLVKKK